MQRITISLDQELVAQFEQYLAVRNYRNRSEAIRDLIREKLETQRIESDNARYCVGTLTYVFNHAERELARRLTHAHHAHHDVAVSTMHVHLDHDNCLETVVVSGSTQQVKAFADTVVTQPGVRHGTLNLIPVDFRDESHRHGHGAHRHPHAHPQT